MDVRERIVTRVARELHDGDYVNLGIGMPTLVGNHVPPGIDITLPIAEMSFADWDRILRTNLYGPFMLSKHASHFMRQQGQGHIVNIVSTAAKRAWDRAVVQTPV